MRTEDWTSVTISPAMGFIAKTELANKGVSIIKSLTLPALSSIVGNDMPEDLSLCPVRALKIYLQKTDSIRSEMQKKLFISFKQGHNKDIANNTISGWI
jgi:hypothetical protein